MARREILPSDPSRIIACQEALASFGSYALQTSDLQAILTAACEQVARGLGVPIAKLAVVTPDTGTMLLQAAVGLPKSAGIPGETTVPAGEGSAMGYTLLIRSPVLSTVDTETRFAPSEVVRKSGARSSANVPIWAGDQPFGVLEADSPEPDVFGESDVRFLQLYAILVGAAVERQQLSSRAEALARQRELLLGEAVHRVKNILAVVHAVAWRSRNDANSIDEFLQIFSGRIGALSQLQDLFNVGGDVVALTGLARAAMTATGAREGEQFVVQGPEFHCRPSTAQALSLLFHELTTNACKYGALRPGALAQARIEVSWSVAPRSDRTEIEIHWKERSGAEASTHRTGGFGSALIRNGIPRMLGGTVDITIDDAGVNCVVRFSQEN